MPQPKIYSKWALTGGASYYYNATFWDWYSLEICVRKGDTGIKEIDGDTEVSEVVKEFGAGVPLALAGALWYRECGCSPTG